MSKPALVHQKEKSALTNMMCHKSNRHNSPIYHIPTHHIITMTDKYKSSLFMLMSFLDGTVYSMSNRLVAFSQEQLLKITNVHLVRYFNMKAYGVENPSDEDCPSLCRLSTIHFHKKAIYCSSCPTRVLDGTPSLA